MAFEYRWNSTSGMTDKDGTGCPDLAHCSLYEITTYAGNNGTYAEGYFLPPDPPFVGWKFRDPTDGRTAPVALGCFPASQGWAWDRHKLGGRLRVPEPSDAFHFNTAFNIIACQQYRFQCDVCGIDAVVPGSEAGPHDIVRRFAPLETIDESIIESTESTTPLDSNVLDSNIIMLRVSHEARSRSLWRYTLQKHYSLAYLDIDANGYVDDSAHIGFGPYDWR